MPRRQTLELPDRDLVALARVMWTTPEVIKDQLERRPWFANDLLRHPEVVDAVIYGKGVCPSDVSPFLFFAVIAHQAADELADADWVADWTGPASRLPVFDVAPVLEFADAPGRLVFIARLLAGFVLPEPLPVPAAHMDLIDLVRWLDAAQPGDRAVLLRRLGDLALFQAGVFPDATGGRVLELVEADHLGRSVGPSSDEVRQLVDPGSVTPGLDALETLGSAWYQAFAEEAQDASPVILDVAARIRPARRFLNHLADNYLNDLTPTWGLAI